MKRSWKRDLNDDGFGNACKNSKRNGNLIRLLCHRRDDGRKKKDWFNLNLLDMQQNRSAGV
jgi:hypothetical protein